MIIPSKPGTYLLILHMDKSNKLQIGKLGLQKFPAGYYVYIGSARGPGGLAGRLKRHLRPPIEKRQHWHIDHLASTADIIQLYWSEDPISCECLWAEMLAVIGTRIIPGFGASDCRCPGHLLWFPTLQALNEDTIIQSIGSNLNSIPVHIHPKHQSGD